MSPPSRCVGFGTQAGPLPASIDRLLYIPTPSTPPFSHHTHNTRRSFITFLHPEDASPFKTALALVAFDAQARRRLRCRLKCGGCEAAQEGATGQQPRWVSVGCARCLYVFSVLFD